MTIETLQLVLVAIIGIVIAGLVVSNPFLGIVFIAASLPVTDLLPSIPFLSSILPIIGGVTILGYLFQNRKKHGKGLKGARSILVLGVLFIFWIYITHPQAAWFGSDRNWLLTYLQLVVLAFLAEELLDDPKNEDIYLGSRLRRSYLRLLRSNKATSVKILTHQSHRRPERRRELRRPIFCDWHDFFRLLAHNRKKVKSQNPFQSRCCTHIYWSFLYSFANSHGALIYCHRAYHFAQST